MVGPDERSRSCWFKNRSPKQMESHAYTWSTTKASCPHTISYKGTTSHAARMRVLPTLRTPCALEHGCTDGKAVAVQRNGVKQTGDLASQPHTHEAFVCMHVQQHSKHAFWGGSSRAAYRPGKHASPLSPPAYILQLEPNRLCPKGKSIAAPSGATLVHGSALHATCAVAHAHTAAMGVPRSHGLSRLSQCVCSQP